MTHPNYEDRVTPTNIRNAVELRIAQGDTDPIELISARLDLIERTLAVLVGPVAVDGTNHPGGVPIHIPTAQSVGATVGVKLDDLQLGRSVKRWQPSGGGNEVRSVASVADAIKRHGHKIAAALIGTPSVAALAEGMTDTATDAAGVDDPASVPADSATGAMLAGIPDWATNIVSSMTSNGDDPLDTSARVANDVSVSADSASTVDDIQSSGGSGWTFQAEGNPCSDCAALDGQTFDVGDTDNLPPLHGSCGCSVAK